jgi:hypothetical protein
MSKFLRVLDGDYNIKVQSGGEITLDTGSQVGTVRVTGNLVVQGDNTTVESENLVVRDNTITINNGEGNAGVTLGTAGLIIDRGSAVDAQFLFDETDGLYFDPASATPGQGVFKLIYSNGDPVGLRTNSISAGGAIYLQPGGAGAITAYKVNYETFVTASNDIPNKKYVDDFVVASITGLTYPKIQRGNTIVRVYDTAPGVTANTISASGTGVTATLTFTAQPTIPFNIGETIVVAGITPVGYNGTYVVTNASVSTVSYLNATTGAQTVAGTVNLQGDADNKATIEIDGVLRNTFLDNQVDFLQDQINLSEIRIEESTISAPGTTEDLILQAQGVRSVRIDDTLMIKATGANPAHDGIGLKLYANTQGSGKTGLFYVNTSNIRDEIISKNRSLLFSMIF